MAGAPTYYREEFATQAAKLCLLGATDDELAGFFEVHRSTLYRWKLAQPEFVEALKVGKDHADDRVERSLYHKANGYDVFEQQAIKLKCAGGGERIEIVEVRRHIPADTTACIYWTKNRRPNDWRDRREHTGADGSALVPEIADKDLARLIAFTLTKAAKDE